MKTSEISKTFLFFFFLQLGISSNGYCEIEEWCAEVKTSIQKLGWKVDPCSNIQWIEAGESVHKRPLVYAEFGPLAAKNVTLVFASVHGDEITPLYLAIQLAIWLKDRANDLGETRVVVAPLVNPDGYLSLPRKRVNSRGVDINRNFATRDWKARALSAWKSRFKSDPRRFPGLKPDSEPETLFQEELIRKVKPQKILSIHSPLNFMDYDGPNQVTLSQFPKEYVKVCDRLRVSLKAKSGHFFPGSLGNYSGRELGIPTLTLELPSSDPRKAEEYWVKFREGINTMIHFCVPKHVPTHQ